MDLKEKIAWITGGARMGEAVARSLGAKGCRIVLSYRSSKTATEATAKALQSAGIKTDLFQCDLADEASIQSTLQAIAKACGRLDVLINLASIYEQSKGDADAVKLWDDHMSANARSAYILTRAAASLMNRTGGGRIVHISDWTPASGRPRYSGYSAYYASKAAVKAVTEALALELAPTILVNAIAPGPILAPKGLTPDEDKAVQAATPLKRWGGADEIAKAALFLVETEFVTGETVRVDGGRHLY
jgi:NAD(P)-dependent dehydrogenase (short-subunit alcohol dehydrogenase family)